MKRLTVILTIIAVVCTTIAWIPYVSAHDDAGDHVAESAQPDSNMPHSDKESDCDHCCHFSAHSTGLVQKNSPFAIQRVQDALYLHRHNYISYSQPPPYHPPIA